MDKEVIYPDLEERMTAYQQGRDADSVFENPYHTEYPRPSNKGVKDEVLARHWVEGYCSKGQNG